MNTGCSQTFGAMLQYKVVIITIINNKGREFHKFIIEGRKEISSSKGQEDNKMLTVSTGGC